MISVNTGSVLEAWIEDDFFDKFMISMVVTILKHPHIAGPTDTVQQSQKAAV